MDISQVSGLGNSLKAGQLGAIPDDIDFSSQSPFKYHPESPSASLNLLDATDMANNVMVQAAALDGLATRKDKTRLASDDPDEILYGFDDKTDEELDLESE